uniref:Uncharacterized protein n=1 Tax=Oryza brachyantha TaxID=4533 RepID=J3MLI3_ORYBR
MGLREGPIFFAVGLVHYIVLLVMLYQRAPTNVQLPKEELQPVFFLFTAVPTVASIGPWVRLTGEFSFGARIAYIVARFLYMSLAVRVNMFRWIRFSLARWAYTFPMMSAAIATVLYASEVTSVVAVVSRSLAVGLSGIATVTVTGVRKDLFPNDVPIAITLRTQVQQDLAHLRSSGADAKELVFSISKNGASNSDDSASAVSNDSNSSG